MDWKRRRAIPGLLIVLLLGSFTTVAAPAEEEYEGSEICAACHEEVVVAFAKTAHAVAPEWDAETGCESCHGSAIEHVEGGGDIDAILRFPDLTPREASERCMSCHQRQEKHYSGIHAIHRLGDVACNECHSPHSTADQLLDKTGRELCSTCHGAIASQFDLPRAHPIDDCASCHAPHASRALRSSKSMFIETCGECHFEKTQPFLYPHDVVLVDGCAACHEVHGSPNRHLLRHQAQVNLCYQCHSATVTPGWHSVPRFLNEKCTACHTAIHGSNTSPFFLEE